jgi:transposase
MEKFQTTEFEKGYIVGAADFGVSARAIADKIGRSNSSVSHIISKWRRDGSVLRLPGQGRKRKTSEIDDDHIMILAKRNRHSTANHIRELADLNHVTEQTIRNRIRESGEFSFCWTKRKPFVSKTNRIKRIKFANDNINEPGELWRQVLFSDESPFTLLYQGKKRYIGTAEEGHKPFAMTGSVKHDKKINVWGCFSYNGVGDLHRIEGIMDKDMYGKILENNMIPSAARLFGGDKWIFQQDNDPKYISKHCQRILRRYKIEQLDHPPQSPDLNPIENLWAYLNRRAKDRKPRNEEELFEILQEEWRKIPLEVLRKLIDSMPARCAAVLKSKGYLTKY